MKYKKYCFDIPMPDDVNSLKFSGLSYHPEKLRIKNDGGEIIIEGDSDALESLGRTLIILAERFKVNKKLHDHHHPGINISSDSNEVTIGYKFD